MHNYHRIKGGFSSKKWTIFQLEQVHFEVEYVVEDWNDYKRK